MTNNVNPIFDELLKQFSGQFQPKPAQPPHKVMILIEPYEIDVGDEREVNWITVPDQAMVDAVKRVLDKPEVIDMIEKELMRMHKGAKP